MHVKIQLVNDGTKSAGKELGEYLLKCQNTSYSQLVLDKPQFQNKVLYWGYSVLCANKKCIF